MSDIVVRVESISKRYQLGNIGTGSLSRDLNRWWANLRGKEDPTRRIGENGVLSGEHWALRDLSFEIKKGEAVGIIGKNGAGKSTLLKILSRVTTPTSGNIKVKGRIASLLEVGTGFHPDLTGRENIFLNGAILGMPKSEIKAKFDEIVSFSGVEKYIDTPVKRYSSGMYVRLAFAVAAHLESEILIIDEVLAVGDAEFQKKCLGKMGDVTSKEGRTVLFVSHNISSINQLCDTGIVLINGQIAHQGEISRATDFYLSQNNNNPQSLISPGIFDLSLNSNKRYDKNFGLKKVEVFCDGVLGNILYSGCHYKFKIYIEDKKKVNDLVLGLVIKNKTGMELMGVNNKHRGVKLNNEPISDIVVCFESESLGIFGEGNYYVDMYLGDGNDNYDVIIDAFFFTIKEVDVYNSGKILHRALNVFYDKDLHIYAE